MLPDGSRITVAAIRGREVEILSELAAAAESAGMQLVEDG
jgi:hypothetical protein